MSLFSKAVNRQYTQLAYKVRCYPWHDLPQAGKDLTRWHRKLILRKSEVLTMLDESMEHFIHEGRMYRIVWAYNNVPTEQEWNKKSDSWLVTIELRSSAAIPEVQVAIFNFELIRAMC